MQATGSKSFIELLEDEIRNDLRREIEAEVLARYGRPDPDSTEKAPSAAETAAVHAAGRFETWLASHMGRTTFARPGAAARSYNVKPATPARPATSSQPKSESVSQARIAASATKAEAPGFTASTAEHLIAVELLSRHAGKTLGATFTEDELKSVWRKAALKTHPDRFAAEDQMKQVRTAAIFRELCEAYELLTSLVEASAAKAA